MNKQREYRQLIIKILERTAFTTYTGLSLGVTNVVNPTTFDKEIFNEALNLLLEEGKILSLFITPPTIGSKTITFYFPKGTHFAFNTATVRV